MVESYIGKGVLVIFLAILDTMFGSWPGIFGFAIFGHTWQLNFGNF